MTIKDLKDAIKDLPDEMPVGIYYNGYWDACGEGLIENVKPETIKETLYLNPKKETDIFVLDASVY
jgi:hypothetical protein